MGCALRSKGAEEMSKGFLALGSAFLAFALVVGSAASVDAQRRVRRERRDDRRDQVVEQLTGWNRLGERWVRHGVDRDHIMVTAAEGRFTRIMVRVEHSALELYNIRVTFGDGTVFSPATRLVFGQGGT